MIRLCLSIFKKYTTEGMGLFHPKIEYMMPIWVVIGEINFDHIVKREHAQISYLLRKCIYN